MSMCVRLGCKGSGKRANEGWCDACFFEATLGLDRNKREATMLAQTTGRTWLVIPCRKDSRAARYAAKLRETAYSVQAEFLFGMRNPRASDAVFVAQSDDEKGADHEQGKSTGKRVSRRGLA